MPDLIGHLFFPHKKFTQFIAIRPLDSDIAKDVVLARETVFSTRNTESNETINSQVSYYKTDTLIRNKYMTFEYELYESKEEGKAEAKLAMVDAMLENGISEEKVAAISGFSKEDILKRKALLKK